MFILQVYVPSYIPKINYLSYLAHQPTNRSLSEDLLTNNSTLFHETQYTTEIASHQKPDTIAQSPIINSQQDNVNQGILHQIPNNQHSIQMHDLDKLKAQVSPGDPVHFKFRGQRLNGTVATLGTKCAHITVEDGTCYRVPYQRIHPLGAPKDHSAQEQSALEICRNLLHKHDLSDWTVCLDDAKSRAGACKYRNKQISLSRLYLRAAPEQEILDTILHEIAHALAGIEHHHDAVWRKIAQEIGCTGERCHTLTFSHPRWIMQCPSGCFTNTRNRRDRGMVCKKCKQPVRFVAWTKERALELNEGVDK